MIVDIELADACPPIGRQSGGARLGLPIANDVLPTAVVSGTAGSPRLSAVERAVGAAARSSMGGVKDGTASSLALICVPLASRPPA